MAPEINEKRLLSACRFGFRRSALFAGGVDLAEGPFPPIDILRGQCVISQCVVHIPSNILRGPVARPNPPDCRVRRFCRRIVHFAGRISILLARHLALGIGRAAVVAGWPITAITYPPIEPSEEFLPGSFVGRPSTTASIICARMLSGRDQTRSWA